MGRLSHCFCALKQTTQNVNSRAAATYHANDAFRLNEYENE